MTYLFITVDDAYVLPVEDRIDDGGRRTRIGSDKDISSDTDSNLFDRPVTESATEWAGRYSHGPEAEYDKFRLPDDNWPEEIGQMDWPKIIDTNILCWSKHWPGE